MVFSNVTFFVSTFAIVSVFIRVISILFLLTPESNINVKRMTEMIAN